MEKQKCEWVNIEHTSPHWKPEKTHSFRKKVPRCPEFLISKHKSVYHLCDFRLLLEREHMRVKHICPRKDNDNFDIRLGF